MAKLYKSYFFRGADPAIAEIKGIIGKVDGKTLAIIEKDGGPVKSTLKNWFSGKTKRPQNCTIEAAGRALGMHRVWLPAKGSNGGKK
jgi:hypothetical protein